MDQYYDVALRAVKEAGEVSEGVFKTLNMFRVPDKFKLILLGVFVFIKVLSQNITHGIFYSLIFYFASFSSFYEKNLEDSKCTCKKEISSIKNTPNFYTKWACHVLM